MSNSPCLDFKYRHKSVLGGGGGLLVKTNAEVGAYSLMLNRGFPVGRGKNVTIFTLMSQIASGTSNVFGSNVNEILRS